jgi:rod shape-determining protein MreD
MIITPKIALRIGLFLLAGILFQLSFFSKIELLGTSPDILAVLAVCLGLLGGSLAGAVGGFSVGLLIDCLMAEPLGSTALILLGVGYSAGLYRERFDITSALIPPLLCMGMTFAALLAFSGLQLMLGIDVGVSIVVARDIIIKSIYAFFLGAPIYLLMRRVLRPALIDGREARRSRGGRRRGRVQMRELMG